MSKEVNEPQGELDSRLREAVILKKAGFFLTEGMLFIPVPEWEGWKHIRPVMRESIDHFARWKIELFFKWIKQHLRIKAFYGTNENAVETPIWIAISVYVLVAIVKKQLHVEVSLNTISQVLSVTLFEKIPTLQALSSIDYTESKTVTCNQLFLFN